MQRQAIGLALLVWSVAVGAGPPLSGAALIATLQKGGYVLVMRHADAPSPPASATDAAPGNANLERQLDEGGKASAAAMGEAMRALRIPLSSIVVSPAFRTRETLSRAGLQPSSVAPDLADISGERDRRARSERIRWLERAATIPINDMKNILYVTHSPNIFSAFQRQLRECACAPSDIPDPGQMLVLRPARPAAELVGTIRIGSWPDLRAAVATDR
jgi:phosphohistidine phosphatase SixA